MDYDDQTPERWWITRPDRHPELTRCRECEIPLDTTHSVPVLRGTGPLCGNCAVNRIGDHPITATYLSWLETGDPRWWSAACCNGTGCAGEEKECREQ